MAPKRGVYRTVQFTEILSAVEAVLLVSESSDVSLPVPPLLELITEYADQPGVSTWFNAGRYVRLSFIAIQSIQPLTFLISDISNCIYRYTATNNGHTIFFEEKQCLNVLVDPNSSNRVFVSTPSKILAICQERAMHFSTDPSLGGIGNGISSTLIGGDEYGYEEGIGSVAQLKYPKGMALTANGESLIFCDSLNDIIRSVNLQTRRTSAMAGNRTFTDSDGRGLAAGIRFPRNCIWNRLTAKPQTELFITSLNGLRKLDVTTNELTTIKTDENLNLFGIDQTPSGLLLVSCGLTYCIYSVDLSTGAFVRIAGSICERGDSGGDPLTETRFDSLNGIVLVESERCLAVCDSNRVRKVPLAPHFFISPSFDKNNN